ncbi:MAG: glycosyltransferase [Clostridia bacterium]|nr:glycosyltransferase [Clostridia bacterium]
MKILLASDCYIYQTNGVANVVMHLARELRKLGHEVRVLAPSKDRHDCKEQQDYFLGSVPAWYYPDSRVCYARHHAFIEELVAWKPDVIHLHTEGSIARRSFAIAARTGAPLIMTTHTDYAQFIFGRFRNTLPIRLLMHAYGKHIYRYASKVIAPSEKARGFVMVQAARDRTVVVPNGIPLERYQKKVEPEEKNALLARYGLLDNGCILVMVTRISHEKNIIEILQYFPELRRVLPQAQLLIVGDGPERQRLETYCADHDLSAYVRFTGRIDPDEVYRYYALGDVFVSASTFEVHSMTYLEAMACGLPLVCREDACLKDVLVNGENGFMYDTQTAFMEAVQRILRNTEVRKDMHQKALHRAEEFSVQRFVERTLDVYNQVVSQRS